MKLDRSGLVGRHDQPTEAVIPVVNTIVKAGGKYSLGFISAGGQIRYAGKRIKIVTDANSILLTVVSKLGKQEVHIYGMDELSVRRTLSGLSGYSIS